MFPILLAVHSLVRWLVVFSLAIAIVRGYWGLRRGGFFTRRDDSLRIITSTISHIQLLIGLTLFWVSPIVDYFLHNFGEAVHMREVRFFGMEHITMMTIAITIVTIGSIKIKRSKTDNAKFKTMLVWFGIALVIIFLSIPWSFSPFTSRPLLRPL